jgi:hypothetical protein
MSQANQGLWLSRLANSDLSAKRYYAVKLVAGNLVDVADGTADYVIGFLQNKPTQGKIASVACGGSGTCKAQASAAITEGSLVKVDNTGQIVTGGGSGDKNFGIALEASTAAGDIIEILPLQPKLVT